LLEIAQEGVAPAGRKKSYMLLHTDAWFAPGVVNGGTFEILSSLDLRLTVQQRAHVGAPDERGFVTPEHGDFKTELRGSVYCTVVFFVEVTQQRHRGIGTARKEDIESTWISSRHWLYTKRGVPRGLLIDFSRLDPLSLY
jgi:hypothetical protein